MLLPYIEQAALYGTIDFSVNMADRCGAFSLQDGQISDTHPNAKAAHQVVSVYLCPSDPSSAPTGVMGSARPASTNYTGNVGWPPFSTGPGGGRETPAPSNGFFGTSSGATPETWDAPRVAEADFTDGLSNTGRGRRTADRPRPGRRDAGEPSRQALRGLLCARLQHHPAARAVSRLHPITALHGSDLLRLCRKPVASFDPLAGV